MLMSLERYSRQILFSPIGREGQERISRSRVLIVGSGALGCAHAEALTRAGVGSIRIVDRDFVEYSNLQRQTLFTEADADERIPKAVAARERLSRINSQITIEAVVADVTNSNVEALIDGCDVVIDGTDNFQIRYLLNDACVKHSIPWIYGAAVSSYGTTITVLPGESPCLRCIFDEMPSAGSAPTCDTAGVIMPIISSISAVQVTEAIKLLIGDLTALHGSLVQIDLWTNQRHAIKLGRPEPGCICCGARNFEFLAAENAAFAAVLCGRDAIQIAPAAASRLDLPSIAENWSRIASVKQNEYLIRLEVNGLELTLFADGRAIIKGTDEVAEARAMYSRFVGD